MKKFIAFTLITFCFTLLSIFVVEKADLLGLKHMRIRSSFTEENGQLTLSWQRLPYPCFYKIETFSKTTGTIQSAPRYHFFQSDFTIDSKYNVPSMAIPLYYRITAYGMFGRLSGPSMPIPNPHYEMDPLAPVAIYHYTQKKPASLKPFLVWHTVPNAVCYELELLSEPPAVEGGTQLAHGKAHLFSTRQVYTNGYQIDLTPFAKSPALYWRARALGLHHEPIGEFSKAEPITVNTALPVPDHPLLNNFDRMPDFKQPLYPVYEWIPLAGTTRYEVELLTHPPKQEHDKVPTADRLWYQTTNDTSSCYDEYKRADAGDYYWRVRAVDKNGNTIGAYSNAEHFVVTAPKGRPLVAIFGDSISHGGGAVSYSPAALEYSYATYLDFPALNLSRSGDTSHMTRNRFKADVLPLRPRNLIILTGSNSLRADDISADEVISDLKDIQKECERNDIRPILLTLMPINPTNILFAFHTPTDPMWRAKLDKINDFIRRQPYHIDLEPYFYDSKRECMDTRFSIDGLHPDIRGKMLMAEIINLSKSLLKE